MADYQWGDLYHLSIPIVLFVVLYIIAIRISKNRLALLNKWLLIFLALYIFVPDYWCVFKHGNMDIVFNFHFMIVCYLGIALLVAWFLSSLAAWFYFIEFKDFTKHQRVLLLKLLAGFCLIPGFPLLWFLYTMA